MNIIDLQDNLKDVSDDGLMEAFRLGSAPQFLVLSELKRRKRMRDEYQRQQAADIPTVAEEVVTGAGVPQQGIMQAARAIAPNTNTAQNTGIDTAMSTQPTQAPQQLQMAADGGILKLANGGRAGVGFRSGAVTSDVGPRSGTITSAIANLKVNFPELYEQYKDEPEILEQLAFSRLEGKDRGIAKTELALSQVENFVEPDESFSELGVRENPYGPADPFKPTASMFKMDDSGGYRGPIDRFTDSLKRFDQSFLADTFLSDTDPNSLMYPPVQPGEYKYKGNMFTLNPDGTMVSEAGIPVDDAGKAAILAANIPKVPIPNYGEKDELPPGAIEQDFTSLIADDSDGTPVEPLDLYNLPQSIIDARKMSTPSSLDFIASDGVPSSRVGGFSGDMTSSSVVPTRLDVPIQGTERPPAFDRYPEPAIPELPDLSGVEEQQDQDAVKSYLAGEDFPEGNVSDVVAMLNKAREFQESDTYTPPEEIYSGDPREIAKYQGASDEEIQAISDRLAVEADEAEAKKIADTATRRGIEEDLATEDAAAFLALNQPAGLTETERAQLKAKGLLDPIYDRVASRQAEKEELERLIEQADIERGGYESAAKKAQELERQEELKRLAEEATGTGTGTEKASEAATDLDAEIARQLQKLDKERDTNKWLALAEAGMKMMSSTNPTLLGAVGEAGLAGTKALKTSQSEDSKTRLGLLALQQRADAAETKGGMTTYQRQMLGKGYIAEGNKIIERGQLAQSPEQVAEGKDLVAYGRLLAGLPSLGSSGMTRTTVPAQV